MNGIAPGPRRIRVSHAGHEDLARVIDVPPGGRAAFHAVLSLSERRVGLPAWVAALVLVAALAVGVLAWRAWRRPESRPSSIWAATPVMPRSGPGPGSGSGGRGTPPGQINPGVRQDEEGREWFGDFRLLGLLGRGGMASVWKAELRGEVSALKRPLGSFLEDRPFIERFLREADIGRTLNHPNIVRILARGEVDTVPYFTMELLAGQTLQALIRERGALPPRDAGRVVVQIAEALDFAHSKGVIHRDLKPSNVMLLEDGTAKVMDFGIARALRFDDLTASGAFLGTPDYVAPEMIEGHGTEPRSDLYTLGVVFYEALTGQRPFGGDVPFAILRKHCTEEPLPPSRIAPGIPPELEAIVLRLMRKRPDDRPRSAEDLVVMLRDWLNRAA
jgi:serine/threonine protein kinase